MASTKEFLVTEHELTSEQEVHEIIDKLKKINEEVEQKDAQLDELTQLCDELQKYPDVQDLAVSLLKQLKTIKIILSEHKEIVLTKIEILLVHLVRIQEEMASLEDKTLGSSPMPDEELVHSPVKQATVEFLSQEQKPTVCAVETQTSQSLTTPVQKTVETKDISITCHPPIDMQVQTEFSSSSEAKPPSKETIRITKTVTGDEETIQIATKPCSSQPIIQEPDDLLVQAEYDQKLDERKVSELNIEHSAPFETVFVEPDETTTEVIVDPDGTRRIIVRKLRRTVVSRQQMLQQQQLTSMSTLTEGDIPVSQSFSQVTLQGQQSSTTIARGDGSKEVLSSQNFGGRVLSSVPGGELKVQEFQMEPECEYTVIEGQKPTEVEVQGIMIHEGDITYVDDKNLSLNPPETQILQGEEIHTSSSSVRAVVQQVTRRIIRKTRRIIKRVTIIDGKEHVTEEVIEEPEEVDVTETEMPRVSINVMRTENGQVIHQHSTEPAYAEGETITTTKVAETFDVTDKPLESVLTQASPSMSHVTSEFIACEQQTPQVLSTEAPTLEMKTPEQTHSSSVVTEFIIKEQGQQPVADAKIIHSPDKPAKKSKSKDKNQINGINKEEQKAETITIDQATSPIAIKTEKPTVTAEEATSPIIIKSETSDSKSIDDAPVVKEKEPEILSTTDQASSPIKLPANQLKVVDQSSSPINIASDKSDSAIIEQVEIPSPTKSSITPEQKFVDQASSPLFVTSEKSDIVETTKQLLIDQASSPILPQPEIEAPKKENISSVVSQFIATEQNVQTEIPSDSSTPSSSRPSSKKQKRRLQSKANKEKILGTPRFASPSQSVEEIVMEPAESEETNGDQLKEEVPEVILPEVVKETQPMKPTSQEQSMQKPSQTVEIELSVEGKAKSSTSVTPKVAVSMRVEKTETANISQAEYDVVRKDVDVRLPKTTKSVTDMKTTTASVALSPIIPKVESDHEDRTASDIDHGGRRSKRKKKHKDKSQEESPAEKQEEKEMIPDESEKSTVISPDGDGNVEEVSVETSLAESTEIIIADGESLVSDTPKPTEEIFDSFTSRGPDSSDRANDTGYEPDDKTTLDEVSVCDEEEDGDKKKKRKKKRKQKIKVKDSEESEFPKSLEESSPVEKSDDDGEPKYEPFETVDPKKKKKRRGKKDDGKKSEPEEKEVTPIPAASPEKEPIKVASPEQETAAEAIISPDASYQTISETSEEGAVKIVEEAVVPSPQSEALEMNSQIITTVPVLETVFVHESTVQTSPDQNIEFIEQEKTVVPIVSLESISSQTSPEVPKDVSSIFIQTEKEAEVPKPETIDLSTQVISTDVVASTDDFAQTSTPDKPEEVITAEISMQTVTPDKPELTEQYMQTISPEPVEIPRTESSMQTTIVELQESSNQTVPEEPKPVTEVPEVIAIKTSELSIQTDKREDKPQSIQTSPEPEIVTSEQAMQTISPDIPEKQPEEVVEQPILKPIEIETSETTVQTIPVVISAIGEEPVVKSPVGLEEFEIQIQTTVTLPEHEEQSEVPCESVTPEEQSSLDSTTVSTAEIQAFETIKSVQVPVGDHMQATINLLKAEESSTPSKSDPEQLKQHKKQNLKDIPDTLSESSERDYSINITVQGMPIDNKSGINTFIEAEKQQSEPSLVSVDKSEKRKKSKKVSKKKPMDDDEEEESASIVVGKVITDMDESTVKVLSQKQKSLERTSSKDSDSIADTSQSSSEIKLTEPNVVDATITAPVHEIETLTIQIKDDEPVTLPQEIIAQKTKPITVKPKGKSKHKTSVTIEEVMSPTEIDVPITPGSEGPMSPPNLNYPSTTWTKPDSQQFIEAEKQTNPLVQLLLPAQDHEIKWKQATAIERVKNLQNARKTTHLSDVLYLATLNEIVTEESIQQKNSDVQQNLNVLKEAVAKQDIVVIQETIITTVETITTWLETIEYRIYLNRQQTSRGPSEERVKELVDLKEEIGNIEQSVGELQGALQNAADLCNEDDKSKIEAYISSLQQQIKVIEVVTTENEHQANQDLTRWIEFINGVNNVTRVVQELKQQLDSVVESDSSPAWKLQELEILDNSNRCHMLKCVHLLTAARGIMRDFPSREVPQEIYISYELTKNIEHIINLERDKALQLQSLTDEYEQTLKEFAQITDIADALVESSISVTDLEHLQEEMQKHRKFFVNLSHCRSILESLEGNLDSETRQQHSVLHRSLHERASIILDKAASRAQKMALAASRWTVLEQGMREETRWLQVAQQRVPDLTTVTSADYDQYINLYQSLSIDIAHHHAKLSQLNSVAEKLHDLVDCTGLEQTYGDALQVILKLQEDVNINLKRLIAFRETWTTYNMLTDKLEYWIREAEIELGKMEVPAGSKFPAGRHMRQFWVSLYFFKFLKKCVMMMCVCFFFCCYLIGIKGAV